MKTWATSVCRALSKTLLAILQRTDTVTYVSLVKRLLEEQFDVVGCRLGKSCRYLRHRRASHARYCPAYMLISSMYI